MKILSAFLLLVVLPSLSMAQQKMMPYLQDPFAQRFSGVPYRSGERSGVPPLAMRPRRLVEEREFTPNQGEMKSRQHEGGKLTSARKTHITDTFYLPDTVLVYGMNDTTRHTYTYDASGNKLTRLREDWNGTQWVNDVRTTYTYDGSGNTLTGLVEGWDGSQWVNSYCHTYTYDGSGNTLTGLVEGWDGSQWVNSYCYTYTYDGSGNMLTWLTERWEGTQWVNYIHSTYTYDGSGNMLTSLTESWDGTHWVSGFHNTYTYDGSGNMLTLLMEYWNGSQWVNNNRYTYTYDGSGNMLTWLTERWEGTQWVTGVRYTYAYDISGNMLTRLRERWNGLQWVNSERHTYTYDANGNISLFVAESWSGSTWVPKDGGLSFSCGKNDYSFSGCQITLSYTETTTSVAAQQEGAATSYELQQNYPNPFNPSTTIDYTLPHSGFVSLKVYNVLGEEVAILLNDNHPAGVFKATWDASGMPSGVYFCRLTAGEYTQAKKMLLLR